MPATEKTYYNIKRLHVVFAGAALSLLAVTVWMLEADYRRPWKEYQRQFYEQSGVAPRSPAIHQIWLPELTLDYNFRQVARSDRCVTCHAGIDQAASKGDSPIFGPTLRVSARKSGQSPNLPQPYAAHPRLDLFVGSKSPHPMAEFGCTVCHDGQGSATDFRWASHAPNDLPQRQDWQTKYGWSFNPNWDLPMLPRRFQESRCLKCHRQVTELEPSRRFADPPAAKLMAGYHLVRQYGCFGCHEIPAFSQVTHKVGPSLRNIGGKLSAEYLADRIRNPQGYLPDTRMPRLYGHHEHLDGQALADAERFEPVEIRGMVEYLLASASPLPLGEGSGVRADGNWNDSMSPRRPHPNPLPKGEGTASAARGKQFFETRGCLACHKHRDFPKGQAMQGPDLSNVGAKFRTESGTRWLTGWLRDPARYSPQTRMPNPLLELVALGEEKWADPVADLAAYLRAGDDGRSFATLPVAGDPTGNRRLESPPTDTAHPTDPTDLIELGRRTIARRGCFGCHDIPGFEKTQPIGPSLSDWGRKPESMLAFERIDEFAKESYSDAASTLPLSPARMQGLNSDADFFRDALLSHRREGFLWQKLRMPRSFDYAVAAAKPYSEQLTMGRFDLSDAQREAISTFILAQVAEPMAERYVYRPDRRRAAIVEGRKVLDKYACAECHTLELERWTIEAGSRGTAQTELAGMPRLSLTGTLAEDEDDDGKPVNFFTLWEPATIDGRVWPVGGADVVVSADSPLPLGERQGVRAEGTIEGHFSPPDPHPNPLPKGEGTNLKPPRRIAIRPPWGGTLARLLYPVVLAHARESGSSAAEVEAWGWLPPALVHEGAIVQPEWLFRYLLDPTVIRPAAVLRMPRFNLTPSEATKLTDYFAAVAGVEYPYTPRPAPSAAPLDSARLDKAMKLLLDQKMYCAKCHLIGDYRPAGENRTILAPQLEDAAKRLRPEEVRRWLADPKSVLPYTAMPAHFPPTGEPLGQDLFPGSSREQLDAVTELLLRYEEYMKRRTPTPAP